MTKKKKKRSPKPPYAPKLASGKPVIGFAAKPIISPPWNVKPGDFTLDLVVRSAGGVGRGLALRISGDALQNARFSSIEVGDLAAELEPDGDAITVKLPDVELGLGVVLPLDPKPKGDAQKTIAEDLLEGSHLTLRVHGHATTPSSDMLRVELCPLDDSSSALKWMRPLVIA